MKQKPLILGLVIVLFLGITTLVVFLFSAADEFRGTYFAEPYPEAADFTLTRADGTAFHLSEERGSVVLLFFGYTACPDICPTTLAELRLALEALKPAEASRVKVLFVTVDPARDTPEHVQEYVNHFNTEFIGLSGSEEELSPIWQDYGVYREIVNGESAAGYLVNHTARVTLIDQNGSMRVSFPFDMPVEDIVHDLKLILKGTQWKLERST